MTSSDWVSLPSDLFSPCVYRLLGHDGKLLYIGSSGSGLTRIGSHVGNQQFHSAEMLRCDQEDMIPLERALILVEKPLRNSIRVSMSEAAIAEVLSRYGMGMDFQSPSARGQSAGGPSAAGKVMTVRQFAESQPALSEGSVRWDLFNSKSNGLDQSGAILRRGKRILIDADLYMAWMRGAMR